MAVCACESEIPGAQLVFSESLESQGSPHRIVKDMRMMR